MKRHLNSLRCQMELVGVLTREIPTRLVEISRSGCLLESGHRIEEGTVGPADRSPGPDIFGGRAGDAVRRDRGSGSSYLVGVEFLQTGRPDGSSIRRAIAGSLGDLSLGTAGLSST